MRRSRAILLAFTCGAALVAVSRGAALAVVTVADKGQEPALLRGDRVLVDRWAYGYRTPWGGGARRYLARRARRGDMVVFNSPGTRRGARPDTSGLCVGRVLAGPGDTVWLGAGGRVSHRRDYARGCVWPLVVPADGTHVRMSPWTARLYALTIHRHEAADALAYRDSLYVDGLRRAFYRFHRDYYWIAACSERNLHDSRVFGFVPSDCLLGRASAVLYSVDPERPWYACLRGRFFRAVGGEP